MWEIIVPPRIFAYNFNEKGADSYFPQSGIGSFWLYKATYYLFFISSKTKRLDAYVQTVRVHDDYNLRALQALDTDDLEVCEFSSKFKAELLENSITLPI